MVTKTFTIDAILVKQTTTTAEIITILKTGKFPYGITFFEHEQKNKKKGF